MSANRISSESLAAAGAAVAATRQHHPTPQPGEYANDDSVVPDIADVRELSRRTAVPYKSRRPLPVSSPSRTSTCPRPSAMRSCPARSRSRRCSVLALLAPKLIGKRCISHICDLCNDEGAGLFAGLNVLPKTTYATDYSYKTERVMTDRLIAAVIAKIPLGDPPLNFNLDFHAVPFRGDQPDLENHWVPMRNRALPSVMAFVAQAAGPRVICYATANILRDEADRMVPKFADYWKEQTGHYPARLLFDSRATTYAGLSQFTQRRVGFITIRRRGSGMLAHAERLPADRWHHCQITQAKGKRRQVHYVDEWVQLDGYDERCAATDRDGVGARVPDLCLDQRPAAAADGPRSHPDLRQQESRGEPAWGTDHFFSSQSLVQ